MQRVLLWLCAIVFAPQEHPLGASWLWVFGFGFGGLGFGFWVLGFGVLVLGFGVLVLVLGFCLTCFGILASSCVLSARQLCAAEPLYWLSRCIIRSANYLLTF